MMVVYIGLSFNVISRLVIILQLDILLQPIITSELVIPSQLNLISQLEIILRPIACNLKARDILSLVIASQILHFTTRYNPTTRYNLASHCL